MPSHRFPSQHVAHEVRFLSVPPDVNDPGVQVVQELAFGSEYVLSALQSKQEALPPGENEPARQVPVEEVPSQNHPPGQIVHVSRVLDEPPWV